MEKKKYSLGVLVLSVMLAILISVMTTFIVMRDANITGARLNAGSDAAKLAAKIEELDKKFNAVYIGETDYADIDKTLMLGYLAGTGDPYAYYYTAEEYKEMTDVSNGNSQGIGVTVIYDTQNGLIEIITVIADSAAEKAGVQAGDLIAYIGHGENRQSVAEIGYEAAVNLIRGESGTVAEITVLRGEAMEEIEFSIERGSFSAESVYSHLYSPDPSVGVIKITEFERVTPGQFKEAVESPCSRRCKKPYN